MNYCSNTVRAAIIAITNLNNVCISFPQQYMTSWLIYSSSHPQCRACSGCSVFVEWKSEQIKRSFISSKGRARHEYSVFTGASDKLEDLEKWIWAKGKFSKRWGHSNPNRVSCGGAGRGVGSKKKKSLEILPGLFCCPGFHCRSREAERSIHTQKKGPRGQPPHPSTLEMGPGLSSAEGQRARQTRGLQNTL